MKTNPILTAALAYHARGWNVIPIAPGSKKSNIKGTKCFEKRQSSDDVRHLFEHHAGNIAIVCGAVSGNLCVFDAETPELFEAGLAYVTKVSSGKFLHAVRTARGGHIYFVTERPIHSIGKRNGWDYEIRSNGSYVMAPPSIHPSGVAYEQIHSASHLPLLGEWPGLAGAEGVTFVPLPRPSRHAREIMRGEIAYVSRSEADHALIASLHQSGFDLCAIQARILKSKYPSKLRSLSEPRRLQEIKRSISKLSLPGDRIEQERAKIAMVQQRADQHVWSGRTGNADRLVLYGHIAIASRAGRLEYCARERELSNLSSVSRVTIRLANERLIQGGWISRPTPTSKGEYTLKCCETIPLTSLRIPVLPPLCLSGIDSQLGAEKLKGAGEVTGIGRTAAHLWELLCSGPKTGADLAELTGKGLSAVYRALRKLRVGVCAVRKGALRGQWEALEGVDWNKIALDLDVRHKPDHRKHVHFQQRQARRENWLNSRT